MVRRSGGSGSDISANTIIDDLVFIGVKNPVVSGPGTFDFKTTDVNQATIDEIFNITVDIVPGVISSVSVAAATGLDEAGITSAKTDFTFTTSNPIPNDGKIVFTFPTTTPPGPFDLSGAGYSYSGFSGTVSVNGNNVTVTRDGTGSDLAPQTFTQFRITQLQNPSKTGTTGSFIITTLNGNNMEIDTATGDGYNIAPGELSSTSAVFGNYQSSATDSSITISFTLANTLPKFGEVHVTFPFSVSNQNIKVESTELNFDDTEYVAASTLEVQNKNNGGTSGSVTMVLSGFTQQSDTGSAGDFLIITKDTGAVDLDRGLITATPSVVATGSIIDTNISVANKVGGTAPGKFNITFNHSTTIGYRNRIIVTTTENIFNNTGGDDVACTATTTDTDSATSNLPFVSSTLSSQTEIAFVLGDVSSPGSGTSNLNSHVEISCTNRLLNNPVQNSTVMYNIQITGHTTLSSQFGYITT
jgi:hypothetical protein